MAFEFVTRRFRRPRPAALVGTVTLLLLGITARAPLAEAQAASLVLSTSGGYDDNVLGRPGETSELPVLTEGFFQLSPAINGSLQWGSLQFAASYGYLFNAYGSAQAGVYHDHLGQASIAWQPRPRLRFSVDGSAERFRRSEFHDFDLDRLEAAPRVSWQPHAAWSAEAALRAGRLRYPQRLVTTTADPGGGIIQNDTPLDIDLSVTWQPAAYRLVTLGGSRLDTGSNRPLFRYGGWRGWGRGEARAWLGLRLGLEATLEKREYDQFPVLVGTVRRPGGLLVGVYERRADHSTLFALDADRRISTRIEAFAELSRLDYHSTAAGYSFGETRLRAGLQLRLGSWRKSATPAASPPWETGLPGAGPGGPTQDVGGREAVKPGDKATGLEPVAEKGTVRFRCRAPGARSVALVGDFNGWLPDAAPMTDPDGDGVWEVRIPLTAGTYRYMFLVDGIKWARPEGAVLYEDDGFGTENGILVLP